MPAITELLHTDLPLLQAPMAGVQGSRLAVAVCEAGALGALPCALLSPSAMREEIAAIRAGTDRPYNVNFFCHAPPPPQPEREAAWRARLLAEYRTAGIDPASVPRGPGRRPFDATDLALLLDWKPPVVSFHFGLPAEELLAPLRGYGCAILSSATTVEEARWLETRGVDAVVAQGLEAGGHRGHFLADDLTRQMGTFALLPQIAAAVRVPVIAAGGIADARGVAAAMALGAAGVQVGTAWLLCPEADTSALHRAALASAAACHTALTNVFTGRPARGIVNRAMREYGPIDPDIPDFPLATAACAPLRRATEARGGDDWTPLWAGQSAGGCREIPAAELVRRLAAGFAYGAAPVL
ncbi:MAG: nitronate monooxygenase [Pseudoxanthomonas sp.]